MIDGILHRKEIKHFEEAREKNKEEEERKEEEGDVQGWLYIKDTVHTCMNT